jgi:FkbM family methyltransferase
MDSNSFIFKALEYYGTRIHHRGKWLIHDFLRNKLCADIDEELTVERNGLKWILNPSDYVHRDVFWYGTKDYWDVFHICNILKRDDVIFDLGANFGYYSICLAKYLSNKCSIYSFEPFPTTFKKLTQNVIINDMQGTINLYQMGVSSESGDMSISVRVSCNSGSATLIANQNYENEVALVKVVTLDDFVERNDIHKINFVKIDVEGFETNVLKGWKKGLSKFKPILFLEIDPPLLLKAKSSVMEIKNILSANGYKMFCSQRDKLVPFVGLNDDDSYVNVLCLNDEYHKHLSM